MTRRVLATLAATVGVALASTGCQSAVPTTLTATGRVLADSVAVQAPTLAVPRVSLDAGFQVAPGASATTSAVPALLSMGSVQRVTAVRVRLGDRVGAGDVLLRFDDAALSAQVRVAKADLAVAKAQVEVIDGALDTLADKEQDLRDKRREIVDGIAKATKARKELAAKLADARKAAAQLPKQLATVEKNLRTLKPKLAEVEQNLRTLTPKLAEVEEQLAQVDAALAALPPDAPPEVREPLLQAKAELTAAKAQLRAGIAKLTAARTQLRTGIGKLSAARGKLTAALAQLRKGIPLLTKAIATIDANLVKARDGLRKIDKGLTELADARARLKRNRKLAVIAARNTTAVEVATVARNQAVVRAPADGVVTSLAQLGDVVAPGATVARIARPAFVVTTWLAPEQAVRVCPDAAATVRLDSLSAPLDGHVSRILPLAAYPPSYHTTDQVHLTRAVPVEVTVASALPAGVPADLQLSSCSTTR